MKLYTAARETGDFIEEVKTVMAGMSLIEEYEIEDRKDGNYEGDFYSIVDEHHEPVADMTFAIAVEGSVSYDALCEEVYGLDKAIESAREWARHHENELDHYKRPVKVILVKAADYWAGNYSPIEY